MRLERLISNEEIAISDSAPSSPTAGDLWYESDSGRTYIYYDSSWVEIGVPSPLADESVTTTKLAANSVTTAKIQDSAIIASKIADNTITQAKLNADIPLSGFRNKIINGGFNIWQRGTSQSAGGYGSADRWLLQFDGSSATRSMSQQSFTPGNTITGQEPQFFLRYNQSVAGSGATYNIIDQRIEDVRTFAGQTVAVSFWAKADSARTLTTQIQQVFGTGGSSEVQAISTQTHSVTTSWQRFTYTATMASISGKTIGTNSYIAFRFNFPNNATFTFDIWGVQVEGNYQPTPFEQRPIGIELALCQRYYEKSYDTETTPGTVTEVGAHRHSGSGNGSGRAFIPIRFKVEKRTNGYSVAAYDPAAATGNWRVNNAGQTELQRSPTAEQKGTSGMTFNLEDGGYAWVVGNYRGHWAVDNEL